jgi:predicted neuraminidase
VHWLKVHERYNNTKTDEAMRIQSIWGLVLLLALYGCNKGGEDDTLLPTPAKGVIFPLQYEHVHGPTIVELPNGDLLTAWFQGSGERWADDVRIMGARLRNGDSIWSAPFLMADTPGFPDINPMLFLDNSQQLWLMWYPVVANQWETSIPKYRISTRYNGAGPPEWSWQDIMIVKPGDKTERGIQPDDRFVQAVKQQLDAYEVYLGKELFEGIPDVRQPELWHRWLLYRNKMDSLAGGRNMVRRGRLRVGDSMRSVLLGYPLSRRIGWQTKNKPYLLDDRIIVPLYSDGFDCSLFAITTDYGKTWQFSNPVMGGIGIQPTIAMSKDGEMAAYLRDNGPPPMRMQVTHSTDSGITWSIARDTAIPNPGAGFDMTTTSDGEWVMVYNESEHGRHDLTVSISDDDGVSWKWKKKLEYDDRGEKATRSHYPAIIQGADGFIHVVYSFHHNDREVAPHKTIKYASFTTAWIKSEAR